MPFTLTESCRKYAISRGVLSAECKKADGKTYITSSIPLDPYLGNIDGKFTWGGKDFSHSADSVSVVDGFLIAKLKNAYGKYVDAKFNLNEHVHNNNGVLEYKSAHHLKVDTVKASPGLDRSISTASAASASTAASAASTTFSTVSATSSATSVSTSASSYSKNAFSSAAFRSHSKHLLLEDTCSAFELKGSYLHADCRRLDGSTVCSNIDLDTCIGNNNGNLEWDLTGFSKTCHSFYLEGYFLVGKCRIPGDQERYSLCRLDLRTRLCNADGILIIIEIERKLSVMLSEVPWMKFKVIAEPDLSVFAKHPVIQQTMVRIAESTVEHVTIEMHKKLTIAMEEAITVVTASAMRHIALQMEIMVQDITGCATARPSYTEAECLHVFKDGHRHEHGHRHESYSGGTDGYSNGYGAAKGYETTKGYETPKVYGSKNGNGMYATG
ncbi:Cyanovirin-N [Flammula alnicola]|nr:Cyanovirin-N [Flammula alnicola]